MIERLKGFRDFYPEDMIVREQIFSTMRRSAKLFGFMPIDYPSLESMELFRTKSGEELLSQTYSFTDRGKREVTLIPEATPSTVRLLGAKKNIPKPVKWYCIPKLWRYEEPQSGRTREHSQFNADIFGDASPIADAEIIGLACETLNSLGLKGSFEVRINHRQIMERILNSMGTRNITEGLNIIDRFRKETRERMIENLAGNLGSKENAEILMSFISEKVPASGADDRIREFFPNIHSEKFSENMSETVSALESWDYSDIVFDPATVRGLTYYTGIVFEGFDREGRYRSIFGGGRYDNLSTLITGQEMTAVGFGMGDAVLENLLREKNLWKIETGPNRYVIITIADEAQKFSLKLAGYLRARGIEAATSNTHKNLSNSLRSATANWYTHAIIIGKKEMESGKATVRNLSTGEQKEMDTADMN